MELSALTSAIQKTKRKDRLLGGDPRYGLTKRSVHGLSTKLEGRLAEIIAENEKKRVEAAAAAEHSPPADGGHHAPQDARSDDQPPPVDDDMRPAGKRSR